MCGIAGEFIFGSAELKIDEQRLMAMRDAMAHRGPDGEGIYISPDGKLGLAHRRLAIIDLSERGHQPMCDNERKIWITYNGEIYNFKELRNELRLKGYTFNSASDTEVVIYLYKEYGIDMLHKLRGMFSFALWDYRTSKLFLVKDRFGIKPLYYFKDSEKISFASEVEGISDNHFINKEIEPKALISFLAFGCIATPHTFFKGVFSLPAGYYMEISQGGDSKIVKYFDVDFQGSLEPEQKLDMGAIREILTETIKMNFISDAPIGAFLSGGLDSSAICALGPDPGAKIDTFSIFFNEEGFSERYYQQLVSKRFNTNHHEFLLSKEYFLKEIPNFLKSMVQPTVDGFNVYFISRFAKELGLKTVLSGIGGDEVFCGYHYFRQINFLKFLQNLPGGINKFLLGPALNRFQNESSKICYLAQKGPLFLYLSMRGIFSSSEIGLFLGISEKEVIGALEDIFHESGVFVPKDIEKKSPAEFLQFMEIKHYLQNQILKDADKMGMFNSIEIRVPYLDHLLVQKILNMPTQFKFDKEVNKPLLANAVLEKLPKEIIYRKKQAFTFPISAWLKEPKFFESLYNEKGIIDPKAMQRVKSKFLKDHIHWSKLWALLVLHNKANDFQKHRHKQGASAAYDIRRDSKIFVKIPKDAPKTVLIYRIGYLGDTVCAIPALTAIRKKFPDSKIILLTNTARQGMPQPEEIFRNSTFLDGIITYDYHKIRSLDYGLSLLRQIRKLKVDLFIYLSSRGFGIWRNLRDFVFFYFSSCKRMVGFNIPFMPEEENIHESIRLMKAISPLNIDAKEMSFNLAITPNDISVIDALWKESGLNNNADSIAICTGAKFPINRWGADRFAKVAQALESEYKPNLIFVGGAGDKEDTNTVRALLRHSRILDLTGRCTIIQSAEAIRRCRFLISGDTGPVHLAAAVGTRVVGIYSARNAEIDWFPYGEGHTVFYKKVPCRRCLLAECKKRICIDSITVEEVISACKRHLNYEIA